MCLQIQGFNSFVAQPGEEVFPKLLILLLCDAQVGPPHTAEECNAQLTSLLIQDVLWAMGETEKTSHKPPILHPPNLLCSCPSKPWINAYATLGVWGRVCFDLLKSCSPIRRKDLLNIYRLETNKNWSAACTVRVGRHCLTQPSVGPICGQRTWTPMSSGAQGPSVTADTLSSNTTQIKQGLRQVVSSGGRFTAVLP